MSHTFFKKKRKFAASKNIVVSNYFVQEKRVSRIILEKSKKEKNISKEKRRKSERVYVTEKSGLDILKEKNCLRR